MVWFIGDVANFAGALLAGLVPTVVALSIWYIVADAALLSQVVYYNFIKGRKDRKTDVLDRTAVPDTTAIAEPNENAPLLRRNSTDVPGSRRRSSALSRRRPSVGGLASVDEEPTVSTRRAILKNLGAVVALFAVGTAGWAVAYGVGAWKPTPPPAEKGGYSDNESTIAVVFGYASAVAYLGARIPQIMKNFKDQSCEGLSLLFFILSTLGNLTYGAQILCHSVERRYVLTNLPWLVGSLGTIGEDLIIFAQFHWYKKTAKEAEPEQVA